MLNTALKINRPEPCKHDLVTRNYTKNNDNELIIKSLEEGDYILLKGLYSDGLELLNDLRSFLEKKLVAKTFTEQRTLRLEFKKLSNQVLVQITNGQIDLKKAPDIGWLKKLYPDKDIFLLPFPQIQGLNSSWQWYINGVNIPRIRNRIHPYYGVYFPTRFEHLILFDNWLAHYNGSKKTAIDVGIGSGILSLFLIKHGFQKSYGTDVNPNAIIGLNEMMGETKLSRKIELDYGYLFGKWEKQTELIVFNPPWLPASHELERLDEAIYYNDKLFTDFFERAQKMLLPEGRIVLLFSNLGQITNVASEHPIEVELLRGSRFVLEKCYKKSVKPASDKTKRNQYWRASEEVELWELRHK